MGNWGCICLSTAANPKIQGNWGVLFPAMWFLEEGRYKGSYICITGALLSLHGIEDEFRQRRRACVRGLWRWGYIWLEKRCKSLFVNSRTVSEAGAWNRGLVDCLILRLLSKDSPLVKYMNINDQRSSLCSHQLCLGSHGLSWALWYLSGTLSFLEEWLTPRREFPFSW